MRIIHVALALVLTISCLEANEPAMSRQEIRARIDIAENCINHADLEGAYKQLVLIAGQPNLKFEVFAHWNVIQRWNAFYRAIHFLEMQKR